LLASTNRERNSCPNSFTSCGAKGKDPGQVKREPFRGGPIDNAS